MRHDDDLGLREPAAVDDAGVIELVGEHDVARAEQRRQHADVRGIARVEQPDAITAHPVRDRLLEHDMRPLRPRDQPRCPCPVAGFIERRSRRLREPAIPSEREIVVRRQVHDLDAVEDHCRSLGPIDDTLSAQPVRRLERGELGPRVVVETHVPDYRRSR